MFVLRKVLPTAGIEAGQPITREMDMLSPCQPAQESRHASSIANIRYDRHYEDNVCAIQPHFETSIFNLNEIPNHLLQ